MSNSFKKTVKSTGLIGVFEVFRLFLGLIRNKLVAVLLGTTGIGVWGLYLSFIELVQGVSSLGLEKSTVKKIAENKENIEERDKIIKIAQFSFVGFSFLCSLLTAFFSEYFSNYLFGSNKYRFGILVCCIVVFVNSLLSIFKAILNGLREIKKIVISQLVGVLIGNILVLILLPFYSAEAIPIYLLIIAFISFLPLFYSVRGLGLTKVTLTVKDVFKELSSLLKIGIGFWSTTIVTVLIAYLIKVFLQKEISVEAVGIYQASWTISNLYVGVVLTSMGVDFFPKICEAITNNKAVNSIIDEQIEFGLLVSFPFVLAIIFFAPFLLSVMYSPEFSEGASIIRWQMLGVAFRLLGFPFGYALMGKGKIKQYVFSQLLFNIINYLLIIGVILHIGFNGLGVNYLISYIVYLIVVSSFCYMSLRYKPSKDLMISVVTVFSTLIFSLGVVCYMDGSSVLVLGAIFLFLSLVFSYKQLEKRLSFNVVGFVKKKIWKK